MEMLIVEAEQHTYLDLQHYKVYAPMGGVRSPASRGSEPGRFLQHDAAGLHCSEAGGRAAVMTTGQSPPPWCCAWEDNHHHAEEIRYQLLARRLRQALTRDCVSWFVPVVTAKNRSMQKIIFTE